MAYEYMANYYIAILKHYELMSEHFKGTKGYEFYGNAGDALRAVGLENSAKIYTGIQAWGTPEQLIEKLRSRRELLGDFELSLICHYGGMPVEVAEQSIRLFASEVLPELHRW